LTANSGAIITEHIIEGALTWLSPTEKTITVDESPEAQQEYVFSPISNLKSSKTHHLNEEDFLIYLVLLDGKASSNTQLSPTFQNQFTPLPF
jgi:hypothetical protein